MDSSQRWSESVLSYGGMISVRLALGCLNWLFVIQHLACSGQTGSVIDPSFLSDVGMFANLSARWSELISCFPIKPKRYVQDSNPQTEIYKNLSRATSATFHQGNGWFRVHSQVFFSYVFNQKRATMVVRYPRDWVVGFLVPQLADLQLHPCVWKYLQRNATYVCQLFISGFACFQLCNMSAS